MRAPRFKNEKINFPNFVSNTKRDTQQHGYNSHGYPREKEREDDPRVHGERTVEEEMSSKHRS